MNIKIGEIRRAYISKNGDISLRSLVFKIKLIDPTSMAPSLHYESWRVYTPYDIRAWLEPGSRVNFYLGIGFRVPPGFVLYMYLNHEHKQSLEMEEMFITPNDTGDVLIELKCLNSFYLRKYMHIANFIIIPVLNTEFKTDLMYVEPNSNEHR